MAIPINAANKNEWVKPLWTQKESYGTPNLNPITSASGTMEQSMPRIQNVGFLSSDANVFLRAMAARLCPNMDVIIA